MKQAGRLDIGGVVLDTPVVLAPMAGVTDLPFRVLCREQGCGMVCTEMVSAKAVHYNGAAGGKARLPSAFRVGAGAFGGDRGQAGAGPL